MILFDSCSRTHLQFLSISHTQSMFEWRYYHIYNSTAPSTHLFLFSCLLPSSSNLFLLSTNLLLPSPLSPFISSFSSPFISSLSSLLSPSLHLLLLLLISPSFLVLLLLIPFLSRLKWTSRLQSRLEDQCWLPRKSWRGRELTWTGTVRREWRGGYREKREKRGKARQGKRE